MKVQSRFIEMFGAEDILHTRWPLFRMDEVFTISSSRRILKSEWKDKGSIPFIRVRDMVQLANKEPLTNEFFVSDEFYNSRPDDEKVKPGDIIVSATSTVGKTYIIKPGDRFYFKDADVLLFRKVKEINEVFFTYGLTMPTVWTQIKEGLGGTTVAHFLISNACKLMQPLPPLELQGQFSDIIQQADKSKFVGFKSRFIEMFDQAPKVKLGDYITTQSGGTPNTKKTEYYEGGDIPWLSSGEVNQGYITSTEKFITQIGLDNSSAKWTPKDCVVIAMYGATAGKVGFVKIPLTTNQAVCTLLPCDNFKPIFLYYAVSQKTDWMIFKCQGAAQPNISQGIIRSMELPLPSMDEQDKFVSIAEQADKSKYYYQIA